MAASSRGIHVARKCNQELSPERTVVWTEPTVRSRNGVVERTVPVVYYLSRNGVLEHPHFIEVPLPRSSHGLLLRDVVHRLNQLRGRGMANLYSWSAKRTYRNSFVWHDLSEDDVVPPSSSQGDEYVLKGTQLIFLPESSSSSPKLQSRHEAAISSSFRYLDEAPPEAISSRRRNQSCSSIEMNDLNHYKVYKTDVARSSESLRGVVAADAATQTEDGRTRRRSQTVAKVDEEKIVEHEEGKKEDEIEEVSPPPSDSSPETLESLMKADIPAGLAAGKDTDGRCNMNYEEEEETEGCGRTNRASAMLMQLISCGSLSFRDCGVAAAKEPGALKGRVSRGGAGTPKDYGGFPKVSLEDKEYFSGSLVEIKKRRDADGDARPVLKRSNSYNADR